MQRQATNEALDQSAAVQENKQATDAGGPAALISATATDISKEPGEHSTLPLRLHVFTTIYVVVTQGLLLIQAMISTMS